MRLSKMKLLTTSIVAIFIFLSASISFAQDIDNQMKDMNMKDKPEMAEMMKSPHHKLMMAYRQNVLTFAKTLRDLAKDSENFNIEFAKTMAGEIKRSSEMMDKVNKVHMSIMNAKNKMNVESKEKMSSMMMEKMKKHKAELDQHILALEKSVESASVNRKEVEKHSSVIVEMLEGMKMGNQYKDKLKMNMKDM